MDRQLKDDIERYCRVYQNNISDILNKLPGPVAAWAKQQIENEFSEFHTHLMNRLERL